MYPCPNDTHYLDEPTVDVFCSGCGRVNDSVRECATPDCTAEVCDYCDDNDGKCDECDATAPKREVE